MPASSPSAHSSASPRHAAVADPVVPDREPAIAPPLVPDAEPPAADAVVAELKSAEMPAAPVRAATSGALAATTPASPAAGVTRVGFAPIVRVDAPRREVELCATSEAIDSYGTVFDYAASKDAFHRWIGIMWNIPTHASTPLGRVSRARTSKHNTRPSAQRLAIAGSTTLPSRFCVQWLEVVA